MKTFADAVVLASFAADSMALGLHWIYDTDKIDQEFGEVTTLLPPHKGSYHLAKKRGEFTHYGDQSFHLLKYLAECGGNFNIVEYGREWQSFIAAYQGYKDKASRETQKNLDSGKGVDSCGAQSTDHGGIVRIGPLIYCFREDLQNLLTAVRAQTALTHSGPGVIDGSMFLARSCYAVLHGATPRQAFEDALGHGVDDVDLALRLRNSLEIKNSSVRQTVKDFGQACSVNAALPGAVYTILQHENDFETALVETVLAGGDSAARGMTVGMVLGAYLGIDKIPTPWLEDMVRYEQIKDALTQLP